MTCDDRLVPDAGPIAAVLWFAVRLYPNAGPFVAGAGVLQDRAPFHRRLDLAEHQDPSACETRHVSRGLGPLLFGDWRERQRLDLEFAASTGDQPLASVCFGFVGRIDTTTSAVASGRRDIPIKQSP